MTKRSTRFGFDVPDDFPIKRLEAVHVKADKIHGSQLAVWREWAGGVNGTVYRFMSAAAASDEWADTYSDRPSIDLNIRQDQLLFEFFAAALSSLECLAYGLAAIGEFLRPTAFTVTQNPKQITFDFAANTFSKEYPGDPLAQRLQSVNRGAEMKDLRDTRNILVHRSAPGRTFSETLTTSPTGDSASIGPTTWLGQALSAATTQRPRSWIAESLDQILEAAEAFASREL